MATFIEITELSKTYMSRSGAIQALKSVSADVAEGEFVSVVGPSGCGKTTLLMCIAGLLQPSSGHIFICGKKLTGPYPDLGIVFQRDLLLPWRRAIGNILLQAELRGIKRKELEGRANELLGMVGLAEHGMKFPFELSGGMRQRVAICRALLHDPPLLLMDEPFGALDALTRDEMNLDLQRICQEQQKTVIFVTHSIVESIFLSDRVLVLGLGAVVDDIPVSLGRPRTLDDRETSEFGALARRIRSRFEEMGLLRATAIQQ